MADNAEVPMRACTIVICCDASATQVQISWPLDVSPVQLLGMLEFAKAKAMEAFTQSAAMEARKRMLSQNMKG